MMLNKYENVNLNCKKGIINVKCSSRREFISKLHSKLLNLYGDNLVSFVLYGSIARGDYKEDSDIDLLLVIDTNECMYDRCKAIARTLLDLKMMDPERYNFKVDIYPLSINEAANFRPIYLDLIFDAIIIHDRDNFFEKLLEKIADKLKKLGSVRIWKGDRHFWMLKREIKFGEKIEIDI